MHQMMGLLTFAVIAIGLVLMAGVNANAASTTVTKESLGKADGKNVEAYVLKNRNGMEARIMTYGGILMSLKVPDRDGKLGDVVLGHDDLDSYVKNNGPYLGALIGRYGNRIGGAKFTLDGVTYDKLAKNDNSINTLHGGLKGFDRVVWTGREEKRKDGAAVDLTYHSKDGEEGFPGNLNVTAVYTLADDNSLKIEFSAKSDKDTVVNLTAHSYFNLAGKGDILNDIVYINADKFTPTDDKLIPTGELRSVNGTPFDFRTPTAVGARINADDEQIKRGGGYDHNWILNKAKPGELTLASRVSDPSSGRSMEVWTTSPAVQFYTGNFLDGTITGKAGWVYAKRNGLCFEPQHYPDSPNHPDFPTTTLKKGETYHNEIVYKFSAK